MISIESANYLFALGAVLLQVIGVILLVVFFLRARPVFAGVVESVGKYGLLIGFVVSAVASAMTVYYSGVLGVDPCPLCWWQRAFLYPQVALFLLALWKRDFGIANYSIFLSVLGAGIAVYHHGLQMLPGSGLPCPASGSSCAQRILFEFGYVTYPLMALSLFGLLIVLMIIVRLRR